MRLVREAMLGWEFRQPVVDRSTTLAGLLLSFALSAYDNAYDDVDIDDSVATSARTIVREIDDRCPSTEAAGARPDTLVSLLDLIAVSRDEPIFDIDFTSGPLVERLAENVPPRALDLGSARRSTRRRLLRFLT